MADQFATVTKRQGDDVFANIKSITTSTPKPANNTGLRMTMAGNTPERQSNGSPEMALQIASSTVAEPISGLAGIMSMLIPGAPPAGDVVKSTQDALTYEPKSEEGKELLPSIVQSVLDNTPDLIKKGASATGAKWSQLEESVLNAYGPEAATALSTLPTAILEAIPAGLAIKKVRSVGGEMPDISKPAPEPDMSTQYQSIQEQLRAGDTSAISQSIKPDQQILSDAEELGIDLNPSHYSTNRAYIDMEQSLKSRPGSKLSTVEEKAIVDLGNKADELVADLGGYTDKSLLDSDIKTEVSGIIADLNKQSDALYAKVDDSIPRATKVTPRATKSLIQEQLAELGGDETLLTTAEKQLKRLTDGNPTYAAIDRVRRDIGSAIGSRSGPFKDDDVGQLRRIYSALNEDQQNFADAFGVGDDLRDAQALIKARKSVEDEAIALFGREFNSSFIPKMTASANALTKGDVTRFNNLMNSVPEARRGEVAATMLNNIFTHGARNQSSMSQGFLKSFDALNRNKEAKRALFGYLPEGAEARFDMLGRVSTGLYRAKSLENTSKTARDVISALDDGGWLKKMYGTGRSVAIAEGASTGMGVPGAGTAAVIGSVLLRKADDTAKVADELLSSPKFRSGVMEYAQGKPDNLTVTPEYKAWLNAQNPFIQAEITAIGFMPWLTKEQE